MCEKCLNDCPNNCANGSQLRGVALSRTKPKKLMDLNPSWMCSLVGTCLTLGELKKLQRRNRLVFSEAALSDYELHGYFVNAAAKDRKISRAMQAVLERKYHLVWKRFALAADARELENLWDEALAEGNVAGPYWAVLAHPNLTDKLGERVFGEVHMLSHLVGATNRADLKTMRHNEVENDHLKDDLEQARCDVWSRDRIIAGLRSEIDELQRQGRNTLFDAGRGQANSFTNIEAVVEGLREALVDADKTNRALQDALARKAKRIEQLELERETLKRDMEALETETHILEHAMPTFLGQSCANDGGTCVGEEACPYDLCQKRVLYALASKSSKPQLPCARKSRTTTPARSWKAYWTTPKWIMRTGWKNSWA